MTEDDLRDLLRQCYDLASAHSDDPVTQNGALVVKEGAAVAWGVNRFPKGVQKSDARLQRPEKYNFLIHAEQDAIAAAAKAGISTDGALLICPWAPCVECARLVIQSGIRELIAHDQIHDRTPERWRDSIERAVTMLSDSGVAYTRVDLAVGGVDNLFNGQTWRP